MRKSVCLSVGLATAACLVSGVGVIRTDAGVTRSQQERRDDLNRYGAVVRDAHGRRTNYTPGQLAEQARDAARRGTLDPTLPPSAKNAGVASTAFTASPAWQFAVLGAGIGLSNIVTAQNGDHKEIYTGASYNTYWVALRYDAATGGYVETFVSEVFGPMYNDPQISRILVGNVSANPGDEIVVALTDGRILIYDQATKSLTSTLTTAVTNLTGLAIADVDAGGAMEIVACNADATYVYAGDGALKWSLPGIGGSDVTVAQMDNDAALEIANNSGKVVDSGTHLVQWTWPNGFGYDVESSDIDGDGRAELISATYNGYYVYAYDVERQLPKWSLSAFLDIGGVTVADVDGDDVPEIVVGEQQWGEIIFYDAVTLVEKGRIDNPEHGVTNIAVDDVDGDGDLDMLWGAGYSSSGVDYLYVADLDTKEITWQNADLVGPFAGPQVGDLDGDGRQELVVASSESNAGYDSGRILVFDARTHRLRAISQFVASGGFGGMNDIRLRDVDGDGRLEIVLAANGSYNGVVEVYDFDGTTNLFTRLFVNPGYNDPVFYTADAADVDGDGNMEIIAGGGGMVFVFDFTTGALEWQSLYMGGSSVVGLELADLDGDGTIEIAALPNQGDVYVFDGPTKQLEAVLFGPSTALTVKRPPGALPTLVTGNTAGELVTYAYTPTPDPYPYIEVGRHAFVSGAVDGITYDMQGRVWIGNGGTLTAFGADTSQLWSAGGYGPNFGRHTAFLPDSNIFFGTTSYGVVEFVRGTGFGTTTPGVYVPATGAIFARNSLAPGPADISFIFGPGGGGLVPLSGDWNGDVLDSPGLFDPSNGVFFLRNTSTPGPADIAFQFGPAGSGWVSVTGDWNGDGIRTVGLYVPSTGSFFLRNSNTPGAADITVGFGPGGGGLTPIVGDWDGDGVDTVGLYNPSTGVFFLRNAHTPGPADVTFQFGPAGAGLVPVVGDWNGDGVDTVGLYAPPTGFFFLRNEHSPGAADFAFSFGPPGSTPLVGDWDGE